MTPEQRKIAKRWKKTPGGQQELAAKKARKQRMAGYPGMKSTQLQQAALRLEEKARKQREKAKQEADRIAFLLANPKT